MPAIQIRRVEPGFREHVVPSRLKVVRIVHEPRPWRMMPWVAGAHSVIELPAGRVAEEGLVVGDRLALYTSSDV
ncbi:MAG: hypothetical protein ACREN8_03790 [Candidatus Dormibacteraceae bacterium]